MSLTRRQLLQAGAATAATAWLPVRLAAPAVAGAPALPGSAIPQFRDPLPLLSVAGGTIRTIIPGVGETVLRMAAFRAYVLPTGALASGERTATWVYGYVPAGVSVAEPQDTYFGPVVVATRGVPTQVRWINDLGSAAGSPVPVWAHGSDQTLHWADPLGTGHSAAPYTGPVPAVPHLHGGEVPPVVDGGPDSWFTSTGLQGHAYHAGPGGGGNASVYRYPNTQEAAPLWFHDHVLGATRLNVLAGLAGAFPVVDPGLALPPGLHPIGLQQAADGRIDYVVPLVIQDRSFDTAGQLVIANAGLNPEHPFWVPEFVGDTIAVNGKVWPYLEVEARRYRFLVVNGSNARAYELFFTDQVTKVAGPVIWQIATDGGYLDRPVRLDTGGPDGRLRRLTLLPGERADVIVDFAGLAGRTLLLRNLAKTPFPNGEAASGTTTGRVLQVRVGPAASPDTSYDPASGLALRPPMVRLADPVTGALAAGVTVRRTRMLTLNEFMGPGGPLALLLNNSQWSGQRADGTTRGDFVPVSVGGVTEYVSELPEEGDTELWELVNLTEDAHPIHTHLTQVQVLNRQAFRSSYVKAYDGAFPVEADGVRGFRPGYGPPLDYLTGNPRALGGNPDITPYLQGPPRPPAANEAGWKDTVSVPPAQVTRLLVRYAPTDTPAAAVGSYPFDPSAGGHGYVWHCHIIDHEDNEMMRPLTVVADPAAVRSVVAGRDY